MACYDDAVTTGNLPHVLRQSFGVPPLPTAPPPTTTAGVAASIPGEIATPVRYAALANLMTAADYVAVDSLSTLTNENIIRDPVARRLHPPTVPALNSGGSAPPTTGRSSRSTGSLESKSDDGSNLDEADDAWENLDDNLDFDDDEDDIVTDENHPDEPPFVQPFVQPTEEPGENSGDDDENGTIDNDVHVPRPSRFEGSYRRCLLKEGESFTPKVEANATKCRLKRGVGDLFRTPAECIAVCGGSWSDSRPNPMTTTTAQSSPALVTTTSSSA
jgi:hypothetical protein